MPELPEVETVRRGLQPVMEGARISKPLSSAGQICDFHSQSTFQKRLEGRRIESLRTASEIFADPSG
jgi:formamidopyrimidine-DNA glycosylase